MNYARSVDELTQELLPDDVIWTIQEMIENRGYFSRLVAAQMIGPDVLLGIRLRSLGGKFSKTDEEFKTDLDKLYRSVHAINNCRYYSIAMMWMFNPYDVVEVSSDYEPLDGPTRNHEIIPLDTKS